MTIGPITFAAPWALAALAALPLLFLVLRATPPAPRRVIFPPLRLLRGLQTDEQSRERAPLWLVLLRALMAALMILAFARPSLAPNAEASGRAAGATLLVIDDGWTSAPFWSEIRAAAFDAVAQAERANGSVSLLLTAPSLRPRDPAEALTPAQARSVVQRLEPHAWRPDRSDAAQRLAATSARFDRIVWLTDGLARPGDEAFDETLSGRGGVIARVPPQTANAVTGVRIGATGVEVDFARSANGAAQGAIAAQTADGRSLGAAQFRFGNGERATRAVIALPPEIAARAARVRIVGEQSAGGVRLLPGGADHPRVGLADEAAAGQPLRSDLYYVERALSPYASLQRGGVRALVEARVRAIILPDQSTLAADDLNALERWLDRGGLVVRFAGPRLANQAGPPLSVALREGARNLGGAIAWEEPQTLRPFETTSPFHGLAIPDDVFVRRMVLAEPGAETETRVWARLTDGAPIVTAAPHGQGLVVLYHVTGDPEWSDLPLSVLYVDMLRRTLAFSGQGESAAQRPDAAGPYAPALLLDGYGALNAPPRDAISVSPDLFSAASAGPRAPPGLYQRAGIAAALDAAAPAEALEALQLPRSVQRMATDGPRTRPLTGLLLGAAFLALALDLLLSLALVGRLPKLARAGAAALLFVIAFPAHDAHAQARTDDPTLILRLAYARTGEESTDRTSRDGLAVLSAVLRQRTAVEPGEPIGVDLARDDLSIYPFIYWAAPARPQRLSSDAIANLDRYMRLGGMLLLDTRDAGRASGNTNRPAAVMLAGLNAPPLEEVNTDHVVARAFYLMRAFPGRAARTQLWTETGSAAAARDGVASLFVGNGDWAAAWAGTAPVSARQRELSLRFGVNIVMVALTGNYKTDLVHQAATLERLERQR
ncbi:MAG: DUF4159 domain-containing protein [Alphaproteobacteria bacterium]|nr:DUF4159 domain-containing protein [Alphaproteobacteria bacterium]